MQLIKKIFGFVWVLWGAVSFLTITGIFSIAYFLILTFGGSKYNMKLVWVNFRILAPLFLKLWLIRLKVIGVEKVDWKGTYVIVSNHVSQLDVVAGAAATPIGARFLSKSELKKIPLFGYMVKALAILVDRKSRESREKSMQYMVADLKKGNCIYIYPEGTRNRTSAPLKEFKDGAFRIAILAQVPIVVQTILNTRELNPAGNMLLLPGTVTVHWSAPISTEGMTADNMNELKEKVRVEMLLHLTK